MTINNIKQYDPSPELEHTESTSKVKHRNKAKLCMLILTHDCNLNCSYCYEKFKSKKSMNADQAKQFITEEIEYIKKNTHFEWLVIELFGGEPLLQFNLIKEIVPWTRANNGGIPVMFMITTNGTLLSPKKKQWFRDNKDIVVIGMSYDGSEKNQITNRGHSALDSLKFCHDTWPNQSFRMTISRESLPTLAKDILSCMSIGYKIRVELAGGLKWSNIDRKILEKQLRILKISYLENPSIFPVLLGRYFKGGEDNPENCIKACGAGTITTCYDVDGRKYPCQMFLPLTLGNKHAPLDTLDLENKENFNDPDCNGCIIKHWCPTCYGMNYITRGSTALRDHDMCNMHLTTALVTSEFQMEKILKNKLTYDSASLLKFLLRIHKKISAKLAE